MQKWHRIFAVAFLFLAMVFLWLSAHDSYVTRINQQQQTLIQSLKQGNHDLSWSLQEKRDLVTGFGSGWHWQPTGLQLDTQTAEMSLAFGHQFIVPEFYQQLTFNWRSHAGTEATRLLLEFSQVDSDIYYYSTPIYLTPGINQVDLSQLPWSARQGATSTPVSWQELPILNTLVWRFSHQGNQPSRAMLANIKIPQTSALQNPEKMPSLSALLSNQLRQHWQSLRLNLASPPVMQPYIAVSSWWLFSIGIVFLIMAVWIYRPYARSNHKVINKNRAILVIALVSVVAIVMQTKMLFSILEHQGWLAIVLFMLPTMLLVKRWKRPKNSAEPVWILTLFLALVLLSLKDFDWVFIRDLPLYLLWALTQQVILGPLVSDYLHQEAGISAGFVALLCGVLFALLHMPNQMLMLATFFGGMLWSYAWLRYQNIYANAVSHALLALLFYQTMPPDLLGTARVGLWF